MAKGDRVSRGGVIYEDNGDGTASIVGYEGKSAPSRTELPPTSSEVASERRDDAAAGRDEIRTGIAARTEVRDISKTAFDHARDLREEYNKLPPVRDYQTVIRQYASAVKTQPNPTGDQALITAYAKMLDPASVVREQEFNTVAAGDSAIGQAVASLNKNLGVDGAGMLRPEVRKRVRNEMFNLTKNYNKAYKQARQHYAGIAQRQGINPADVIGEHSGQPYYQTVEAAREQDRQQFQGYDPENGLKGTVTDEGPPSSDYSLAGIGKALAQGAGSVAEGIGGLAGIVNDPINRLLQPAMGYNYKPTGTALRETLGLPKNPNPTIDAMIQGGTGALTGALGAARAIPLATSSAGRGALGTLATAPMRQAVGGVAAGGSADLARKQGYGPVAQTGAAMLGGMAGTAATAIPRMGRLPTNIPTVAQLKDRAGNLYRQAEARGVTANPTMTQQLADDMRGTLASDGRVSPTGRISEVYPKAREAIQLADDYAGQPMSVKHIETVRKVIADGLSSPDAEERRIASRLLDTFDDWASPQAPELEQARDISSRYLNAQQLERSRELAGARAGQFSGSGFENALRTEYRGLDRNAIKGNSRYSNDLNQAVQNVSRGTPVSNAARAVGRFAPTGVVSLGLGTGLPMAIGNAIGGPALGGAVGATTAGVGTLGRVAATALGRRNADIAELVARNGGALPDTPLIDPETERAMAAILATSPNYAPEPAGLFGSSRRKRNRR